MDSLPAPPFADYARQLRARLEAWTPYLAQIPPTCFLDDVTVKNVIVENGELQGLVDFDVVCYGDPLYMVSLTQTGIASDTMGEQEMFYIEELCRGFGVTEAQRRVIDFYSASHALDFVRFSTDADDAWREKMTGYIEKWLKNA